jgi:hypothetical protein
LKDLIITQEYIGGLNMARICKTCGKSMGRTPFSPQLIDGTDGFSCDQCLVKQYSIKGQSKLSKEFSKKCCKCGKYFHENAPGTLGKDSDGKFTFGCYHCYCKDYPESVSRIAITSNEACSSSRDTNSSSGTNDSSGARVIAFVLIFLGVLISLTGVGAVAGIPIAGVGGLAYLLSKSGVLMLQGRNGLGCFVAIVVIALLLFALLIAAASFTGI